MGLLSPSRILWLAMFVAGAPACAADWELALDLRAVSSDGRESFLDNGQGKLRFESAKRLMHAVMFEIGDSGGDAQHQSF